MCASRYVWLFCLPKNQRLKNEEEKKITFAILYNSKTHMNDSK